ncbi:ketoacyl-synthetase C-terminal extension domain-containing protein [Paenibacillus rhizoplanae]
MQGITGAIRSSTDHQQFCALGAVKTNIGHLDTAAGLAGFMKTVLALKHQAIPATLHFHDPNPHIDFMNSPVFVNTELMPWTTSNGVPRRAGVSAFGLAGTNCHVVLEEYQGDAPSAAGIPEGPEISILTLSAKSRGSFDALLERFILYLPDTPYTLRDICITSNTGRGHYAYRLAVAAASLDELLGKLLLLRDTADSDRASLKKAGIHYAYLEQRKNRSYNAKPNTDLNRLLDEYATGSEIQWEDWYGKHQGRRVPIPVYPFSGKRHWINYIPEQETVSVPQQPAVRNMDDCFYSLQWVPKELDAAKAAALPAGQAWLLFTDDTGVGVFLVRPNEAGGLAACSCGSG